MDSDACKISQHYEEIVETLSSAVSFNIGWEHTHLEL
jgi:hypothetical protein